MDAMDREMAAAARQIKKELVMEAQSQFPCDPDVPNWIGSIGDFGDLLIVDTLPNVIKGLQDYYDLKPSQVRKRLLEKGYVEKTKNWITYWWIQWNPKLAAQVKSQKK